MSNNKKRKRDKHPMIKIQQISNHRTKVYEKSNQTKSNQFIQHPSIKKSSNNTKLNDHMSYKYQLSESDNIACSDLSSSLTFGDNLSNLIPNINDNIRDNSSSTKEIECKNKNTKNEKYKAFVIMNGNTKTIHSKNKQNKTKIIIKNNDQNNNNNNNKEQTNAIIIGECTNKITSNSNDDYTNNNNNNNVNKIVSNVINETSNLCINGNKLIGNNVIRTDKIEHLISKMGSYANTNKNNPITNKFSTYYQRNETIGGILLKSDEIIGNGGNGGVNGNIEIKTRARTRIRIAKKYCLPSEELTRLQIREDIKKMRNPKMNEIKNILKIVGFDEFINHKAYIKINENENDYIYNNNNNNNDDVQFIGINQKKRKYINNNGNGNGNNNETNNYNNEQPQKKRQKLNQDSIKCNQCNKIFTLEVDLLLHKTNDKCC